jgi:signal transduction histidine kinase
MQTHSLSGLFLKWLLGPIILIMLLGSVIAYLFAVNAATTAYDLGLLDNALDLSKQVEFRNDRLVINLPLAARQMLQSNNKDRVTYAAWDDNGRIFSGSSRLLALNVLPEGKNRLFRDIVVDGVANREVLFRGRSGHRDFYIAVSQTTHGRAKLIDDTLASILFPEAMLALVSIAATVLGIRRGLLPIQRLRDEITSRSPADLRPIMETSAPAELAPIIHSINELLEKLGTSFAGHRRFIADASHQLRTPLASLSSQIEVALNEPPGDVKELLRRLLLTTQRTTHLANQLLSLAKLEHTEQSMYEKKTVELQQIVSDAASDFIALAERKNIELDFDLRPCRIHGSALMLRELLANLLDNALRYTPAFGEVHVSLDAQGEGATLKVTDNGAGVPQSEMGMLGIPFYRLSSNQADGCGLGLAIVREIARLHGAEVHFGQGLEGRGLQACITFRAPVAAA